jgi:glycosyltransferase involved in cell wall biosynthesis
MKVLMFGWEFPPFNSGGLGVACFGLTRALQTLGVDVSFVLPKKMGGQQNVCKMMFADDIDPVTAGRLEITEVDSLLTPYVSAEEYEERWIASGGLASGKPRPSIYGRGLTDEVRRYGLLAKHIAQKEPHDVIHAHDWLSFPAGMAAKAVSGKPLVVHVHATEFDRTGGQGVNQTVYDIERAGMHAADRVVTVSGFTRDIVVAKYGIPKEKVSVVHNGIDAFDYNRFVPTHESLAALKKDGSKIVLFLGRLTIQKGPDYFVKMAKGILAHRPKTYFIVSGSGDMERQMMQEVSYLGMGSRFIFTGFTRGEATNAVYRAADLYIMPSISEPFGITPLESLVLGTPVLMSRQSGVSEVISHALKVDFWDIREMVNKAVAVLDHGSLHQTLRDNGRGEAERATWKVAAEKCVSLYRDFLHGVVPVTSAT